MIEAGGTGGKLVQPVEDQYGQYGDYVVQYRNCCLDDYEIMGKIGQGKFSTVYKAINTKDDSLAAIKVLVTVRQQKINRQIKILTLLKNCPQITQLKAITRRSPQQKTSLILSYTNNKDIRSLPDQQITIPKIRTYTHQILQALKYAHSLNIFHRDIKPDNVLYDDQKEEVVVGDWGLAEFWREGKMRGVKAGSRYFKSPEVLLGFGGYDCRVDMWSLGCIFAGLVFHKSVLFLGDNNHDQVRQIAKVVGTKQIRSYVQKFKLNPSKQVKEILANQEYPKIEFSFLIDPKYPAPESAIDLISKMLTIEHTKRLTSIQALNHKFFTSPIF